MMIITIIIIIIIIKSKCGVLSKILFDFQIIHAHHEDVGWKS